MAPTGREREYRLSVVEAVGWPVRVWSCSRRFAGATGGRLTSWSRGAVWGASAGGAAGGRFGGSAAGAEGAGAGGAEAGAVQGKKATQARLGLTEAPPQRMSEEQVAAVVEAFGGLLGLLRQAEPHDRAEIYTRIGLRMNYRPGTETVLAEVRSTNADRLPMRCLRGT
ncbi:hypothetical protein Aau02nite_65410 [Amorphoplanes auranticolor]|uniref:Uncharacterized protein n=1 Tax=Actinoplanes auranticolor TaxID=47988 RepID=A0A919SNB9_9ACTN|nr:hypothetical protein Aau02nite_65410 [Actinoplanes auranticolor]